VITSGETGVKMSWRNAPESCCVPPETRWTDRTDAIVTGGMITCGTPATYAPSWLSPSIQRQSTPALSMFDPARAFVQATVVPTPLVGTF
jgi:hypothetical protein